MPVLDTRELIKNRVNAIKHFHQECGQTKGELDVSGGLDSAVMLGLLAKAVGPENITAVYSNINSSNESQERAQEVADVFGIRLCSINLTGIYEDLLHAIKTTLEVNGNHSYDDIKSRCYRDPTIEGSLRSCLRAPVGRAFNRISGGGIRHGTGNECEDRWLRFYQKGGDGEVDTNPIAMLSKGEVFQLGHELGVPQSILTALPTPDLQGVGEDHNDESELKALSGVDWTYSRVDSYGIYTKVGTIEAMSRVLDLSYGSFQFKTKIENALFHQHTMDEFTMGSIQKKARKNMHSAFIDFESFKKFALSARHFERVTRHKMNPNCPSLGSREDLLELKILTNELPKV